MMRYLMTLLLAGTAILAQAQKNNREITVHTRVYCDHCPQCETCKSHVEAALYRVKGVKLCTMDATRQTIRVVFHPRKTNEVAIRQAISGCGYDADDVPATEEGLRLLDGCCRKKE